MATASRPLMVPPVETPEEEERLYFPNFPKWAICVLLVMGFVVIGLAATLITVLVVQQTSATGAQTSLPVVTETDLARMAAKTPATEFDALGGRQLHCTLVVSSLPISDKFFIGPPPGAPYTTSQVGVGSPMLIVGKHLTPAQATAIRQKLDAGVEVRVVVNAVIHKGYSKFEKPHIDLYDNFQVVEIK